MLPLRDNVPTRSLPVVTLALIATNVAVWVLYQLPNVNRSVNDLGYHPCEVVRDCPGVSDGWLLTLFTSMFLHGSWTHLLGNMLFLWIFGNNVEDTMGRVRFLAFYVGSGFVAALAQAWVTLHYAGVTAASIPTVGASGAIAGVLGAYFVLLPHARVVTLLFGFLPVPISAVVFLGLWFVFQLWQSGFSVTRPDSGGGVAFAAHVGGFLFGALAVRAFQVRAPLRPRW